MPPKRPSFSTTWPVLEGVAAYLFLIVVVWSAPTAPTVGMLGGIGLGAALLMPGALGWILLPMV